MGLTADELLGLAQALGPGGLLVPGDDEVTRYEVGARGERGQAAFVARPASTDEVRATLAWALDHGVGVVPQGANTGVVGASVPDASGRQGVLSLERLGRPLDVLPHERAAVVGAGVRLSELNAAAAPHGLFFGVDVGADPSVGGMVATNTGGSRTVRYGDVRRHVLGLEVVLACPGTPVLSRLRVLRKDNSGLDMAQLFAGTGGSFGVVTAAVLSLDRLPRAVAMAMLVPRDVGVAVEALERIESAAGEQLSAFELVSGPSLAAVRQFGSPDVRWPFPSGDPPPLAVLVELSSVTAEQPGAEGTLADVLIGAVGPLLDRGAVSDAVLGQAAELWRLRHETRDALWRGGTVVGHDVSVPRAQIVSFRADVVTMVAEHAPGWVLADFGHLGDGGLHVVLWWPTAHGPAPSLTGSFRQALYDRVAAAGGSFSAEHGIGPVNAAWYRRYVPGQEQDLAALLKSIVDPAGVLVGSGLETEKGGR